jgi:hypothetical protein
MGSASEGGRPARRDRSAWEDQMAHAMEAWAAGQMATVQRLAEAIEDHKRRPPLARPFSRVAGGVATDATSVTGAATALRGWALYNNGAAAAYVKLYDTAELPAVGVDYPALTILVPAGGRAEVPPGDAGGVEFQTGLGYAITTGPLPTDVTSVPAASVIVNLFYPLV